MRKVNFVLVALTLSISCSKVIDPKIEGVAPKTDLEKANYFGKIKSIKQIVYEVDKYESGFDEHKFGEPIFKEMWSLNTNYNKYGFITKQKSIFSEGAYGYSDSVLIKYSNQRLGIWYQHLISTEDGKAIRSTIIRDSITNKKSSVTTEELNINHNKIKSSKKYFSYNLNEITVSEFKEDSLVILSIEKYDKKKRINSEINYNKEGEKDSEKFYFYSNGKLEKDSTVNYEDGKIWYNKWKKYDLSLNNRILEDSDGNTYEYDNETINSSFVKYNLSENSYSLKKVRRDNIVNAEGNIIKTTQIDLDTKKIIDKTVYKYEFYK
tara:strand:+ start:380 stop:1345 length:966 start_codon:yes stop_codon:yes gene_type:complete